MSTFACGGGSSMGYKRAGYTVVAANDIDPEMAWHYKKNINPKHYFLCPIRDLLTKDLPDKLFDLDILDGSPPCSTFSMAGKREKVWKKEKYFREGQAKQVLSDLFFDYIDLAERLKPKVLVAENVKGMLMGNARGYTKAVVKKIREIGYDVQVFLLNAAACGVPQKRNRIFFCAIRSDLKSKALHLAPNIAPVSCIEATKDLVWNKEHDNDVFWPKTETNPHRRFWHKAKPGQSYSKLHPNGSLFNWVKLNGKKPSCTLTATMFYNYAHWSEPRCLTYKEWCRLGSFPDDYLVKTKKLGRYLIGMSVPPKMIEFVAKQIHDQWLQKLK